MPIDRAQLFGNDLRLDPAADGLDLRAEGSGDLALARGNDNIVQALTLRLEVRLGELEPLGWPDYGSRLHEVIGEPNLPRVHAKIMAFARAAVETDPRVKEVTAVSAFVLPGERNVVRVEMEIELISEQVPLNLVHLLDLAGEQT